MLGSWVNFEKEEYINDPEGNIISRGFYSWNSLNSKWDLNTKVYYYYSAFDVESEVKEFEYESFKLYPNPLKETLNLESAKKVNSIQIFNGSGETVMNFNIANGQKSFDVSELKPGMYFIQLKTEQGYL
jgi:hypothetical protein